MATTVAIAVGVDADGNLKHLHTSGDFSAAEKALTDAGNAGEIAEGYVYKNPAATRRFRFDSKVREKQKEARRKG